MIPYNTDWISRIYVKKKVVMWKKTLHFPVGQQVSLISASIFLLNLQYPIFVSSISSDLYFWLHNCINVNRYDYQSHNWPLNIITYWEKNNNCIFLCFVSFCLLLITDTDGTHHTTKSFRTCSTNNLLLSYKKLKWQFSLL